MAVHIASDEIVRWITGQPGAAATRIIFRRKNVPSPGSRGSGTATETYDVMVVDADGENLRRLHGSAFQIYSPVWSPDARKLAWAGRKTQGWSLVEFDLATGRTRDLHSGPDHMLTPAYSPDGSKIAFSVWVPGGFEIFEFDVSRNCCLRRLTDSREDNLSPSYSPDGKTLVFHSTRTGSHHVYAMPSAGGQATQLSPFGAGVSYDAADWSPIGSDVVFQGMYQGSKHLMLGDATRFAGQIRQLTSEGWHEDPSWGPDGRHIVFSSNSGLKGQGAGLYVLDKVTGNTRRLISGRYLEMPDWSGSFATRGASRQ
jgi:TolB protein